MITIHVITAAVAMIRRIHAVLAVFPLELFSAISCLSSLIFRDLSYRRNDQSMLFIKYSEYSSSGELTSISQRPSVVRPKKHSEVV